MGFCMRDFPYLQDIISQPKALSDALQGLNLDILKSCYQALKQKKQNSFINLTIMPQ